MTVALVVQARHHRHRRAGRRAWPAGSAAARTTALMRLTDVIYAFPDLLFIILLSVAFRETVFGQALDGLLLVFVAIGLVGWVTVARLVRGQMLVAQGDRVRRGGPGDRRVATARSSPGTCCRTGWARSSSPSPSASRRAILAEATLAYIGIGVQPPRASWGSLIAEGQKFIRSRAAPRRLPGDLHRARPDRASPSSVTACATRSTRSSRASSRW